MFVGKLALRTEGERRNRSVFAQRFFVVAVPRHALLPVVVQVQEARIIGRLRDFLHEGFQCQKLSCPSESLLGDVGIGVRILAVAIPRHFALGLDVLAKNNRFVIFLRNCLEQCFVIALCFLLRQYFSVIYCLTAVRQHIEWKRM